ncbi:MAG: hypothetical protein MRZ49_03590 [Lachnospiraceae bacterium]|nr:hypothetical protein [Lachnospiraceae bacterium]
MNSKSRLIGWVKNRFAKDLHRIGLLVMDILIVILCLVTVFALCFMIGSFLEDRDRGYNAYSLQISMSGEYYQNLLEKSNTNRIMGIGIGDPEYEEYYAVADYFEALTNYYMYDRAEDTTTAEIWRERMTDAENRMGSLIGEKERIMSRLNIQE